MQNYLIYKASTAEEIHECSYSLLKLLAAYNLKPPQQLAVVIYTSQPALLEIYGSFFQDFQLKSLEGIGASRLAILHHFFSQHQGNALYLDTNTYPVCPLDNVFAEIERGFPHVLGWTSVLDGKPTQPRDLKTLQLGGQSLQFQPAELNKWNDSVIGASGASAEWIGEALARAAQLSGQLPPAVAEKWALHYQLSSKTVKTADHALSQYSDLKEFRKLLRRFFTKHQEESVPNQLKLIQNIDAALIQEDKRRFDRLPLFRKLLRRVTGRHWSIRSYEKKI